MAARHELSAQGRNAPATPVLALLSLSILAMRRMRLPEQLWESVMIDPRSLFRFSFITLGVLDVVLATVLILSFLKD